MYQYVTSPQQFGNFITALGYATEVGFDTETTGTDPFIDKILLIQTKLNTQTFIFDVKKLEENHSRYIIQLLKDSGKTLVGHNIKFDIKFVWTNFGELLLNVYDTMLAEILINNGLDRGRERYYSLADITPAYCGVQLDKQERENFYKNGPDVEITEQMLIYSATDVQYLSEIKTKQLNKLTEQKQLKVVDLEMQLVPVISSMELNGVLLDTNVWKDLIGIAYEQVDVLKEELVNEIIDTTIQTKKFNNALELANFLKIKFTRKSDLVLLEQITELSFIANRIKKEFNVNSNSQMLVVLQEIYGVPITDTNEKTLNKFELDYPIISKLFKYREYAKKVQTYGDPFLRAIHPVTGRIHTEFSQMGIVSGRIASSKPNMQNIPREGAYRGAFIARPGYKIISGDFSQEELRLIAVVAKVKNMIKAFLAGIDLHLATAAGLFSVSLDQVTKDMRYKGKTLNFAVGYGSTEYGLYKNFGIPIEEGRKYLEIFYRDLYPEINLMKRAVGEKIEKFGYSVTLLGRKRFFEIPSFFPGGNREREKLLSSILREGFNHIIQGTGAEILKKSLIRMFYENPFGDKFRILLQVYDEIVCEVSDDIAEEASVFMKNIMLEEETCYLKNIVPSAVDVAKPMDHWVHA